MLTPDSRIPNTGNHHVVLFGGAFNPPHIGHLIVIQQAFEMIPQIDELWLLPDNVGSFGKELAPAKHRLAMTKLLLEELPAHLQAKIRVETKLIDDQLTGETYENLKILKTAYPSHSFSFLMGSDNVVNFEKWSHWQDLPKVMRFYVYPRNGHLPNKLYENMTLLESDTQVITNFS